DASNSEFDMQAGNKWADPGVVGDRIGASPYQPFPAILLGNYKTTLGIVHGTLSQNVFYHNYLCGYKDEKDSLHILSSFKDIAALEVKPGRLLVDEWYLGRTEHSDDIERIFEGYAKWLRKKLPCGYGRTENNRTTMVWGSWNDGIFRNISEDMILREAKYLRDNFPTVRWIQLDDGYCTLKNHGAHGLGVPYEGESGVDKEKFPNGLRHYTDELRKIGMHPAIWIGGFCPSATEIYKDHPEWFLDYTFRTPKTHPLDVSKEEVREYMLSAIDTLITKYGFEGVKHDFWSYAFEDSHDLYSNKDKSGYEYRRWWLSEVRKRLPGDGYFQTGCDIVMASPFLGEFFTNYRYGIDIGSGNWEYVVTNFQWGTACFATHTGDIFPPNSDSIGLFPGLSEREAMFCINYCLATHSMVEIAGKLSEANEPERLRILKKAACNPNNGQDVYFIGYDYRAKGAESPEILYFKTPHFSPCEALPGLPVRTVAFFNMGEEAKTYTVTRKQLMGLSCGDFIVTDVWSDYQCDFGDAFTITLEPHESRMFAVSYKTHPQLYDANFRVNDVKCVSRDSLTIVTDYAVKDAELRLSGTPKSMTLNGNQVSFEIVGVNTVCELNESGTLEIVF
nr:alpha-galactosidase [Clostridia bacterium]